MNEKKIRQKIQEEIANLSEKDRKSLVERWDKLQETIKSPEEMLAKIDARCKVLKEAGAYDIDKIREDFKQQVAILNEAVDALRRWPKK